MSDQRMWFHSLDYRKDRGSKGLVNRGFWLHGTPRLIPLCRLRGHRPVVDGVDFTHARPGEERRSRWACCDRCGVRLLQPIDSDGEIGQPYTDDLLTAVRDPRGVIGGQVVVWGGYEGLSVEAKVGSAGSENTLAAHVHLGRLGALYLHTERHGAWLQRRLNPVGYESRVVSASLHGGRLSWRLWAKRNEYSSRDPKWMNGSVQVDPRTILLGPLRYSYTDVGDPVTATVRMPHGDDHTVTLQLRRQAYGRTKSTRKTLSWSVDWDARPGIPTKNHDRGRVQGSAVEVSDAAATDGGWVEEACGAIAAQMTKNRTRYGYRHEVAA